MNLQLLLPVLSKAIGRDLQPDVELFYRSRAAVGTALNEQGQKFFIENWRGLADFMETPAGQEAIAAFVDAWVWSTVPETVRPSPLIEEPAA